MSKYMPSVKQHKPMNLTNYGYHSVDILLATYHILDSHVCSAMRGSYK